MRLLVVLVVLICSSEIDAAECDTSLIEDPTHHFICSNYYNSLIESLQKDENELYWLQTLFFPVSGSFPHQVTTKVTVHVDKIISGNCTGQKLAFLKEGSVWVREWIITVSDSAFPSSTRLDFLFALDSSISWAVYQMATGLGSIVSNGGNIRFRILSLPCAPGLEVMTEVIEKVMSEIKAIARRKGAPGRINEKDMLVVSSVYAMERDGSHYYISANKRTRTWLLISAFVLLNLMTAVVIGYVLYSHYKWMWGRVQTNYKSYHSLYWAVVFVTCGADILRGTTFTLSLMVGRLNLSDDVAKKAFTIKIILTFLLIFIELAFAAIIVWRNTLNRNRMCQKVPHFCKQLLALFIIIAFVHNITAAIIPIATFLVVYPAQILSALLFICSSLLCLVIFVAHILHLDHPRNDGDRALRKHNIIQIFFRAILLLLFIGLLGILVVFYLKLLSREVRENAIVGFLITLTPSSFLLFIFRLALKKLLTDSSSRTIKM